MEYVGCVSGTGGPQQGLHNPTLMHILKLSDCSELPWPTAPRSVHELPRSQRSMSPVIFCCKSLQKFRRMVHGLFDTQNAIAICVVMAPPNKHMPVNQKFCWAVSSQRTVTDRFIYLGLIRGCVAAIKSCISLHYKRNI